MSRAAVTRSITQTKQAGTLAVPWGIRSHSFKSVRGTGSSQGDCIRVDDYRENQGRHRGIERSAGVIYDSVTGVKSSWASSGIRASKGARGSDDGAVPEISSGPKSLYPIGLLFVNPKKISNSRDSGRRKRGSYRPCRGP